VSHLQLTRVNYKF